MEIKKITNKLSFEVEAQDTCQHGKWRKNPACSRDCTENALARSNANDWYAHKNGWLADCDCYIIATYQCCQTSHSW